MFWNLKPELYRTSALVEERLGYAFCRRDILLEALTHRSALVGVSGVTPEVLASRPWNERLEFLGDSVLGLVISEALLASVEALSEGEMSRIRAAIVCEDNLARIARKINLGEVLVIGGSEIATGGHNKPSILADALEALLGAVFLDGGWQAARRVIQTLFVEELTADFRRFLSGDAKTKLQEITQAKFKLTPTYDVIDEGGPAHQKYFKIAVRVGQDVMGHGSGASKKEATQAAARNALLRVTEASP